jgi:hypothetical protein
MATRQAFVLKNLVHIPSRRYNKAARNATGFTWGKLEDATLYVSHNDAADAIIDRMKWIIEEHRRFFAVAPITVVEVTVTEPAPAPARTIKEVV